MRHDLPYLKTPRRAALGRWLLVLVALALCASALSNSAYAATLVSLNPELTPGGPPPVNFTFGAGGFADGSGSHGNGDGNLAPNLQHAPGLELKTPLTISTVGHPELAYGIQSNADGSTTFYDTTLVLSGLAPSGPATSLPIGGGLSFDFQNLGNGTFTIYGSGPGGFTGLPTTLPILLTGTLTNATVNGLDGATIGSTVSSTLTFTGGAIFNALVAHGGTTTGSVTFNLSLISGLPGQSGTFVVSGSTLLPFSATGQGIFTTQTVPEPTSIALMGFGSLFFLAPVCRRWRRARQG